MRAVRVQRFVDLIGRFPGAAKQILQSPRRTRGRHLPAEEIAGLARGEGIVAGEARAGFFEHPDLCIVYRDVTIPTGARLQLGFGVTETAWDKPGDGVRFKVAVARRGEQRSFPLDRYINPKARATDRRWFDADLELGPWEGSAVDLFFETDGGPAGNTDFDWAFWSWPRLRDAGGRACHDFDAGFDDALRYRESDPEFVRLDEVTIDADPRTVLFQHPPSMVRFPRLPVHPGAVLRFGIGIHPDVWAREGDGVQFQIWVDAGGERRRVYDRYLDAKGRPEDRHWFDEEVSLGAYAGREVALELLTGAGPEDDSRFDWGVWSSPVLESEGKELLLAGDQDASFLLLTLDTMRADHLGCYGSPRVRTPHLDGLAARGVRFARAWCQSNITIPSHLSILTGRFPHRHILDNRRHRLAPETRTLAEMFHGAGYRTFAATAVHILGPAWTEGIDRGFDGFDAVPAGRRPGERVAAAFHEWLEAHYQEPFFAWIHLFDAHGPYRPRRPFHRMYYDGDERDPSGPGLGAARFPPFMEETARWLDGVTDPAYPAAEYAAGITGTDAVVGRILESLATFGIDGRTLITAVADHGEGLGEHGVHYNHVGMHEEVVRIPWILAPPPLWLRRGAHPLSERAWTRPITWNPSRMLCGRSVTAPVMSVDLAPTVAELAGLPLGDVDGRSLVPVLRGRPGPVHARVLAEHTDLAQVMIVQDGWKYLRAERDFPYSESFALRAGQEELFDLRESPREGRDRSGDQPRRLAALRAQAQEVLRGRGAAGAAADLEMDDAMLSRLRDLGYL